MKCLAISGSARAESTNTALLHGLKNAAGHLHQIELFARVDELPVFSPDISRDALPANVQVFIQMIASADGLIIACPEYVHSIPGGLKNAIDWLVGGYEMVGKPIVLMHASSRGDDMLSQLRLVLATLSERFNADLFLRIDLIGHSVPDALARLAQEDHRRNLCDFIDQFSRYCQSKCT